MRDRRLAAADGVLFSAVAMALVISCYACPARAQSSSPIGEGVCVQLVAAFDPRTAVGQSVTGIGGYCSLSGCTLSGPLNFVRDGIQLRFLNSSLTSRGISFNAADTASITYNSNTTIMATGTAVGVFLLGAAGARFQGPTISLTGAATGNVVLTSTGWIEAAGDTAGNISTRVPTAGSGALIYDDTNMCWRTYQNGNWRGCLQDNTVTDGGWGPTNATIFRLASVTTAAGAVDSTMNTVLAGQRTALTARYLTGLVATPGTGAGRTRYPRDTASPR